MKFIWPESQKRVSLKCGSIDSGSALAGGLAESSALEAGVPPLGRGASGCCANAGIAPAAAAISHNAASTVLAIQRIDLRSSPSIHPRSNPSVCSWLVKGALQLANLVVATATAPTLHAILAQVECVELTSVNIGPVDSRCQPGLAPRMCEILGYWSDPRSVRELGQRRLVVRRQRGARRVHHHGQKGVVAVDADHVD